MRRTLVLEMGAETCASKPKTFCRMLRRGYLGQRWDCKLYEQMLTEEKDGWLMRCPRCLEEFPADNPGDLPPQEVDNG